MVVPSRSPSNKRTLKLAFEETCGIGEWKHLSESTGHHIIRVQCELRHAIVYVEMRQGFNYRPLLR